MELMSALVQQAQGADPRKNLDRRLLRVSQSYLSSVDRPVNLPAGRDLGERCPPARLRISRSRQTGREIP